MHNPDVSHSFSQPGLVLPTQSLQNQIYELAKTLPPPRKQNTACDACRARKVKCCRLPGQDKCQHCLSKNYPCTHYVQQATSEKKRNHAARRPRGISTSSSTSPVSPRNSPVENGLFPWSRAIWGVPWGPRIGVHAALLFQSSTPNLLSQLFAPPDTGSIDSVFPFGPTKSRSSAYVVWGEMASRLEDESFRIDFALDLVEVYFQIVHTRLPLLNPSQFRARLNLPHGPQRQIPTIKQEDSPHPALIATVLAWGAKFSEHPLLVADRQRNNGQSLMAKALIERCRELAESMKVHRIPQVEHVVIALLIEPLQCQDPTTEPGFHGFWLGCGIRNLLGLQINHKSVMADIKDPDIRGTMIFAWWMACLADAFAAFYYRRKPLLDDDDYDIDFYTAAQVPQDDCDPAKPSPRDQLEFLGYYNAAHALARISRQIARQLWRPQGDADGIPVDSAMHYTRELVKWRDLHLSKVGVPTNLAADWDFVTAVSACASDAQYHVMWIGLFNALDEFGIQDETLLPSEMDDAMSVKRKVYEEALNASLRVSALAGVLTSNGYLKLDTAVMHVSIIQAGSLLARLGRPEVNNCIEGLLQYSYAYEETREKANQIRRVYEQTLLKGPTFNEMSNVIPCPSTARAQSDPTHGESRQIGHGHHGNGIHHTSMHEYMAV